MSLTELLLLAIGAIIFAAALSLAIGIASHLSRGPSSSVTRFRASAASGVTVAPHRDHEIQNDFYLIKRE
jgi:hypothetical protein